MQFALTWRSKWSFTHADVCRFNARLRRFGVSPASPRLYPAGNRVKSYAERALARAERVLG